MRILFLFLLSSITTSFFAQKTEVPKLVVGIVVDQMTYEYLYRYENKFSKNGFLKLMNKGANCSNTTYNYVPTYTGPGHASIYTGTTPSDHGIVSNDWFDRSTNQEIYCVDDSLQSPIGTSAKDGKKSPHRLKSYTITDQLKLTYPNAKVFSASIKDRSSILPGGHLSDGSYWYDYTSGRFITSSFFKQSLPAWIEQFNGKKYVDESLTKTWETMLPIEQYIESEKDNSPYEVILPGKQSPVFPYNLAEIAKLTNPYELFVNTPYANTYLTDFAIEAISNENLGEDAQVDMLCVSYSTPDYVGHAFGPKSVEIEDIYIRLDLEIARLMKALDEKVGKNQYVIFLTADHAVVPVPQMLVDKKMPGGYFFTADKMLALRDKVKKKFGTDLISEMIDQNIYLNHALIKEKNLSRLEVADYVADEFQQLENVKAAFTFQELEGEGTINQWHAMVKNGYHPKENGDVVFILEPGYLPKEKDKESAHRGTSHGSAWGYDTHVPLLWYGKGILKQEVMRSIDITDIAATLVRILRVQKMGAMTGEPILEVMTK
ncbi:MAG: alkaline phosphatase PafA [Bacteroidota bacterium]